MLQHHFPREAVTSNYFSNVKIVLHKSFFNLSRLAAGSRHETFVKVPPVSSTARITKPVLIPSVADIGFNYIAEFYTGLEESTIGVCSGFPGVKKENTVVP